MHRRGCDQSSPTSRFRHSMTKRRVTRRTPAEMTWGNTGACRARHQSTLKWPRPSPAISIVSMSLPMIWSRTTETLMYQPHYSNQVFLAVVQDQMWRHVVVRATPGCVAAVGSRSTSTHPAGNQGALPSAIPQIRHAIEPGIEAVRKPRPQRSEIEKKA